MQAPIRTNGNGARGFELYDGSLREASFESIATTGDCSVGIQISKALGSLTVPGDVTTGGAGGREDGRLTGLLIARPGTGELPSPDAERRPHLAERRHEMPTSKVRLAEPRRP